MEHAVPKGEEHHVVVMGDPAGAQDDLSCAKSLMGLTAAAY